VIKNKLVDDLSKVDWKSIFIIGQKIGTSNFILQFLEQSLSMNIDSSQESLIKLFNVNSEILYITREFMTESEKEKIKKISNVHNIRFLNFNDFSPLSIVEICQQKVFTHIVFDDVKPFYLMKGFPKFIYKMSEANKKVLCGFCSTDDKIKNQKFLLPIDLILSIDSNTVSNSYTVELLANLDALGLKKKNLYLIDME
jgi:hypothetical protein